MCASKRTEDFYSRLPLFADFARVADPNVYEPLPDNWTLGLCDIFESTKAIAHNGYKAVNMCAAAALVAVTNAVGRIDFPFVFGGDGVSLAIGPDHADAAMQALADTAAWVDAEFALKMRAGAVSVAALRDQNHDLRVARYKVSNNLSIAMFTGGGLGWAEEALKRGDIAFLRPRPGSRPDLNGLSCRYEPIPSRHGIVLSLLVAPGPRARAETFAPQVRNISELLDAAPGQCRPVSEDRLRLNWPPRGLDLEIRATQRKGEPLAIRATKMGVRTLFFWLVMQCGLRIGSFEPERYTREVTENSDYRKFDDSLRMVLDCTLHLADKLEEALRSAARDGVVRYGTHRQDAAIMTCFTPSPVHSNHVHFLDAADGGYAKAAAAMKARA